MSAWYLMEKKEMFLSFVMYLLTAQTSVQEFKLMFVNVAIEKLGSAFLIEKLGYNCCRLCWTVSS